MKWLNRSLGACALVAMIGVVTAGPDAPDAQASAVPKSLIPRTYTKSGPTGSPYIKHGACVVSGGVPDRASGPPARVRLKPSGVDIVWLPGLNDYPCRAYSVAEGAVIASELAQNIDAAKVVTNDGRGFLCPNGDNRAVRLYFTYSHNRILNRVDAFLNGCRFITAPGKGNTEWTTQMSVILAPLAPYAWARYFTPYTTTTTGR